MKRKVMRIIAAVILTLPYTFLSYFICGVYSVAWNDPVSWIPKIAGYSLINVLFFLTVLTQKTDRFRWILFVLIAVSFPVEFILGLFEQRGHFMVLTFSDMITGRVPFCHLVIPQTILPMLFGGKLVFPGTLSGWMYSAGFMIMLWISASLLIGKGFCSWVCFYGGWEDGCSRLPGKPRLKLDPRIRWGSAAVLLLVILVTIESATPVYCIWLCPFKACSEFVEVSTPLVLFQTIVFAALFIGFVLVLPFLSKKRTQCMAICPFGAFQSLVDRLNPFDIRVENKKCVNCKKCIRDCPVMSISEKSLEKGNVGLTCTKCARCVDTCPSKAIHFHIKGTPVGKISGLVAKHVFLYFSYTIVAGMGSGFIVSALKRIVLFLMTGSFLH